MLSPCKALSNVCLLYCAALATEAPTPDLLMVKPNGKDENIINKRMWTHILTQASNLNSLPVWQSCAQGQDCMSVVLCTFWTSSGWMALYTLPTLWLGALMSSQDHTIELCQLADCTVAALLFLHGICVSISSHAATCAACPP